MEGRVGGLKQKLEVADYATDEEVKPVTKAKEAHQIRDSSVGDNSSM